VHSLLAFFSSVLVFLSSLLASGALLAGILLVHASINPIRAGTDAMIIRIIDKKYSNHPIKFYTITVVFGFYYKKLNFNFLLTFFGSSKFIA
jgi:hypothetical protein